MNYESYKLAVAYFTKQTAWINYFFQYKMTLID